jgi:hypothetical protein
MSITSEHLEAAIIDQTVAGTFTGQRYAYMTVGGQNGYELAIAVANQHGYNPVSGKIFGSQGEAKIWADGLNRHIGLTDEDALNIILSTMRK